MIDLFGHQAHLGEATSELIEGLRYMCRISIAEISIIDDDDFSRLALMALESAKLLTIDLDNLGQYRLKPGLQVAPSSPDFRRLLRRLTELLRGRVRALENGDERVFLKTVQPLEMFGQKSPELDPGLESWMRGVHPKAAKETPFEMFVRETVQVLSM